MAIRLYELAGADPERRFSPYCWRTRMALARKRLAVETVPWRFTEKDALPASNQGNVPVIVDGDRVVHDSWTIACYLEDRYPDAPSLFGGDTGRAAIHLINDWADRILFPTIIRLIVIDIFGGLDARDKDYFRASREQRLGAALEQICADREQQLPAFRQALEPLRATLRAQPFLGGTAANYADYAVFGGFQWSRVTSPLRLIASNDPIHSWCEKMLDAFDGMARKTPGYPV